MDGLLFWIAGFGIVSGLKKDEFKEMKFSERFFECLWHMGAWPYELGLFIRKHLF